MNVPRALERLAREVDGWLDLGRGDRAMELISKLYEHPGARPFALSCEVRALILLERYGAALGRLRELRSFEVDPVWLEVNTAWCNKREGDLEAAVEAMGRLIRRAPEEAIGHYNLGCYLALLGRDDAAIEALRAGVELDASFREHAQDEPDLKSLRSDSRFVGLISP